MKMSAVHFIFVLVGATLASADVEVRKPNLTSPTRPLPEFSSNNVTGTGRSLLGEFVQQAALPFVVRKLGMIECAGLDHSFGGNFFETLLGPGTGADFGGNYLCQPTCGGDCVVTQGLGEAPISIYYPFGCRCNPQRCNENGPVVTGLVNPIFKVMCVPDPRCTCASMGPPGSLKGYLCNWINLNTDRPVTFLNSEVLNGPPERSPIRWCSCCPSAASNQPQRVFGYRK